MAIHIENPQDEMKKCLFEGCSLHLYKKTLTINATDEMYQKNFNYYYRVRRDAAWLKQFYAYMDKNKDNKDITFAEILRYLSGIEHTARKTAKNPTGKIKSVEASFASKMLATINQDHPIWDSQVLNKLGKKVDDKLCFEDKMEACISLYQEIEEEIAEFIQSPDGQECIALFDQEFPEGEDFSDFKKIDFYLWSLGK